jgi:tRNA threonylcarbamoyladenosine biosynthesis protein TsaB
MLTTGDTAANQQERDQHELLILAIETATRAGSVAVARGGKVLSSQTGDATVSHSANLIELIDQALKKAGAELSDINLFAAAVGPGSFTGLRIGLATVKALASCAGRDVVGVSTLEAIAHASMSYGEVVSLLPAGRGEVFAQRFLVEKGSVAAIDTAAHLSPAALLEKYGEIKSLTWTGEGAHQQIERLIGWARDKGFPLTGSSNGSGWKIVQETYNLAESLAVLAVQAFEEGKSSSAAELHAVYVRASDAEINERWQQEKARA